LARAIPALYPGWRTNRPARETKPLSADSCDGDMPHHTQANNRVFFVFVSMRKSKRGKLNLAGPLVRRIRRANDWTQKDFAKMLRDAGWKRCTRGWVSRLESGEVTLRDVDLPFLYALFGEDFDTEFRAMMVREAKAKPSVAAEQNGIASLVSSVLPVWLSFV
jgi:transcriptional regulator with XRE-family HTH domain